MSILNKVFCLTVAGFAIALSTSAEARLAGNAEAANRLGANRIGVNRLAGNRLGANRIGVNRLGGNRLAGNRLAGNTLAANVVGGEGAFSDVSSIELADGTLLAR